MRIVQKVLRQKCVYWPPLGVTDGGDGQQTFGEPEEIKCRWQEQGEVMFEKNDKQWVSKAKVMVEKDVVKGGVLWLGELAELTSIEDPFANGNPVERPAWEIQRFDKIPTLRASKNPDSKTGFLRVAYL